MSGSLARHDELLRAAVAVADGELVKTTGDGVHAAFDSAVDAITVAAEAQRPRRRGLGRERRPPRAYRDPYRCR